MFNFLKKKLKEAVAKFSKKVEEELSEESGIVEEQTKQQEVKENTAIKTKEGTKSKKSIFQKIKEKISKKKVTEEKEIKKGLEKAEELEEEIVEGEKIEREIRKKPTQETSERVQEKPQELKEQEEGKVEVEFEKKGETEEGETKKAEPIEEETQIVEEKRTKNIGFVKRISDLLTKKELSEKQFEKLFWDLEIALLENNVALEVVEKIKNDLKKELVGKKLHRGKILNSVLETLKNSINSVLSIESFDIIKSIKENKSKGKTPFVILFLGVNGSGKTTTIAKIAHMLKKEGISSVIAASDTFRAAAINQLEEHAKKLGIKVIKHDYGADAAAVAYDTIEYAKAHNIDVVLIDTAGRLHSNKNLMEELKKIVRVTKPDLKIFVGESITGNDCVEQAKTFNNEIGIDAIILTKADVDEKGGAALSITYITRKPIIYLGTGQNYDDLIRFNPEQTTASIIG